jgi:hypothetical protein
LAVSLLTLLMIGAIVSVRAGIRKCTGYPDAVHGLFGHVLREPRRE